MSDRVEQVDIEDRSGRSRWLITGRQARLAFRWSDGRADGLPEEEAVVHSFLPTHDPTGFPFRVNADVDTDPSRTKVVLDERTLESIVGIASEYVSHLEEALQGTGFFGSSIARGLSPFVDPRIALLQRPSFRTKLIAAIRDEAGERLAAFRLRPSWMPPGDFYPMSRGLVPTVAPELDEDQGLRSLLSYLGAREASLEAILAWTTESQTAVAGAAALVAAATTRVDTGSDASSLMGAVGPVWYTENGPVRLEELIADPVALDSGFVDLVTERVGSGDGLRRLLERLSSDEVTTRALASKIPTPNEESGESPDPPTMPIARPIPRWRGGEVQVAEILRGMNWTVSDVSRSNVGYDLECVTDAGEVVAMEVKVVKGLGQPFILTSNEEVVARQRQSSYCLAIVADAGAHLEVAFVFDPMARLEFARQCRQWVWECSSYAVEPQRFAYGSGEVGQ